MDHTALLARIVERDRRIAALQAEQFADVAALAGSHPVVARIPLTTIAGPREIALEDAVREELACALRLSSASAYRLVDIARMLAGPLQRTAGALAAGEISLAHVAVMVESAHELQDDPAACADLERRLLPRARETTPAICRSAARKAVLAIDPEGCRRRRDAARRTRDVFVVDEPDGLATLVARLSRMQARAIHAAVLAHAPACWGDAAGERRANALVGLVLGDSGLSEPEARRLGTDGRADHDSAVGRPRVNVALEVVVDLLTLLGLRDEPVHVGRVGVLAADELRDLLADRSVGVTLRRLVCEPLSGRLLDRGRRVYEPAASLRAFIVSRDRTCRFPGCARRAEACDVDHAVPWASGGRTDRDNLGALCRRHHGIKTHAGWSLRREADDTVRWTSPLGRSYAVHPEPWPGMPSHALGTKDPPRSRLAG